MRAKNKHGLSDYIPEDVRREVRRKAGFGCVMCGRAIGDYHHFSPEFADARGHHAQGIVYLCLEHHGLAHRRRLAPQTIVDHAARPAALRNGFSFGAFDMQCLEPMLIIGSNTAINCTHFFRVRGIPVLSVKPPERPGGPFRLNADFADSNGTQIIKIVDNEWRVRTGKWDVRTEGPLIKIYSGAKKIDLVLRTEPPNTFRVERLNMATDGFILRCAGRAVTLKTPSGYQHSFEGANVKDFASFIDLEDNSIALFAAK